MAQDALLSGSTLTAGGNILLDAGNNLSILASHLDGENIGLTAFNELLIASGEESSIREIRTKSGGFLSGGSLFSSTESLNGVAKITADSSTLNATGNLVIDAGSATVIGSLLNADKGMHISTDIGDINVLAAKETERNYSKEETIKVGFGDVLKSLTKPGELIQTSGGQLTVKLAEASYDKVDFESTAVEQKGSELSAGENLTFNSVADILLEGATVTAKGDVNLIADGNVAIKEAETTYSETKEEVHGKADLSLVVQHQAVEVVKAAEAVDQAKDQVKQAEADYRKYQKERDQLEGTLAKLEADYQNKVPGVSYNDILELRTLLDDIKGDEAWYQAGIATASANLVSKSTLLLQQTAAAAQSSATYGFNAGLQLNIAATKTDSSLDMTGSLASGISGNNINILTGGDGQQGSTLIQGSHLAATNGLNIYTGELNVLASQDTMRSETDTQSGTMTIAQTVWGAAGGPTVNGSFNSAQQQDKQTTHTNSSLTADSLNIVTTGDANIIGGNLHGASLVTMNVGGDLTLESVQDRLSGSSKGFGISGGTSFGGVFTNENGAGANSKEVKTTAVGATDGVSGVNGGVNASNSRYQSTETLLSSITGGAVAIDVNGHTQLNGALIAALDAQGKDTGNLSLTTGSFAFTDLTNKSYSSSQSVGVNANLGLSDKANAADPAQSSTEAALNSSTYSYQNESSQSLDKTLATIGQGNITVGGEAASPEGLNRDVDNTNKEIYAVDRQQGNIDLTVDHRLLSDEGREEIGQQFSYFGDNIQIIAQNVPTPTGGNAVENAVGEFLNKLSEWTGGILPSDANAGGLIAQIPVLFGNNDIQAGAIQVRTANDEYVLSNPDAFMPASELPYFNTLDAEGKAKLEGIVVSRDFVAINSDTATYQNHTNGILNNLPQALVNAMEQTDSSNVTSHYNPTHGGIPDLLESLIDKAFGNAFIKTGVASQTGEFVKEVVTARADSGSNFIGHSQGSLLMNAGLNNLDKDDFSGIVFTDYKNIPTFFINGAPVQAGTMETTVGNLGFNFTGSAANSNDSVAELLGRNRGTYIPSLNQGSTDPISIPDSLYNGLKNLPKLGDDKYPKYDSNGTQTNSLSPHSTYDCKINCGDKP
ncbi:hemagglutinin repeat-containing protein [Rheinheimera faecalis]